MNTKKAQPVLFILVAVVLVFVFILVFRMIRSITQEDAPSAYESEVGRLENYIKTCMDKKLKYAIIRVGRQGGRIYDDQGGRTPYNEAIPFVTFQGFRVHLDLSTPNRRIFFAKNHFAPYTCDGKLPVDPSDDPFLPNSLKLRPGCYLNTTYDDVGNFVYYAEFGNVRGDFEYDLYNYLNNTLDECYDFSEDEFEFDVSPSDYWDLDVLITDEEVVTNLQREVLLEFDNGRKEKITSDFRNVARVRMKKLVRFIHQIVREEERNLTFSPAIYSRDGFEVRIERNVDGTTHDILRFIDMKSFVYGDKFEIWVGRENYYPIISFLPADIYKHGTIYVPSKERVYINISDEGGVFHFNQYLPDNLDSFIDFYGNCSNASLEKRRGNIVVAKQSSQKANESLFKYLSQFVGFYDRDEDKRSADWKVVYDTNLSCAVNNVPREFYANYSVEDGEFIENSTIFFKFVD